MKKVLTILAAAALALSSLGAQELTNFAFGGRGPRIVSPEVKDGKVTFRLNANYATRVQLSGNWMANPWTGVEEMKKGEGGIWEITIDAPEPEIYTYNFIVDGVSVNDPLNDKVQRDGSRYLNMLFIPGERSENYYEANQHGSVTTRWYNSPSLGYARRMTVYTPYGYEENKKAKYPVLYLLHGGGGDEEAWSSMGRAAQILDNLIEKGLAKPMIVVMPNGNPNQKAANTLGIAAEPMDRQDPKWQNAYVTSLVKEIVPFIDKEYRTIAKADGRAILPEEVIAHLGCSRRLAELRFSQIAGTTIHQAIEKARMDEVQRRLKSGVNANTIANELQFTSPNQLYRIYKRHFGHTIRCDL